MTPAEKHSWRTRNKALRGRVTAALQHPDVIAACDRANKAAEAAARAIAKARVSSEVELSMRADDALDD